MMDENGYLKKVAKYRDDIESGDSKRLASAERGLEELADIKPWRLSYMTARIACMLARGEDKKLCRNLLDVIDHEMYEHKELADIFLLKKRIFPLGSNGWKQCEYSAALYGNNGKVRKGVWNELDDVKQKFLGGQRDASILCELAEAYYVTRNMVMYFILMSTWCKTQGNLEKLEDYLDEDAGLLPVYGRKRANWGLLWKIFQDKASHTFVLVDDLDTKNTDLDILAYALGLLGQKIFFLREPRKLSGTCQRKKALEDCIINAEARENDIVFHPALFEDGSDNRAELLSFFANSTSQSPGIIFFSTDRIMDEIHNDKTQARYIQRLSHCLPRILGDSMAFGRAGDYLDYISYLYGFSAHERIEKPAECEFSIVIPVRNSADTLRYTLQTCLDIDYDDYEIVLSDNSDAGNNVIYELVQELNDPRIHYYRVPYPLDLPKSFEFAFLQARGEFIFSLGADDAVYPWIFKALHKALPQLGDSDVLTWIRDFYAWPGFNGGQQNQLTMNLRHTGKVDAPQLDNFDMDELRKSLLNDPQNWLYSIPLLYINSGFRRSYMKHLWKQVGRLWDGASQDVPMGVVNVYVLEKLKIFVYPLTVAGMSGHSIGRRSSTVQDSFINLVKSFEKVKRLNEHMGEYVSGRETENVPGILNADWWLVYEEVWRLYRLGLVPETVITKIDKGKLYIRCVNRIIQNDILFERYWSGVFRTISLPENMAFLSSVKEAYRLMCRPVHIPSEIKEESLDERLYTIGVDDNKIAITVDADMFGIKNIWEAVQFSVKLMGR